MDETALNDRLRAIETNLSELKMIIETNHKTNQKGIAENVSDLKLEVAELYRWKNELNTKIVTYASVAAFFVGLVMWIGDKIISIIYK